MNFRFFKELPKIKTERLLFVALFIAAGLFYNLQETMFYRPQSLHVWRQADCLSITQNYYQHNSSFWEPEIHNQLSDDDLSGKSAGEFPLLYYSVAQIWKLFGKSEFVYRLIVLLISFIGLFYLLVFSQKILKNSFQVLFVSLGLMTSVVYVYYAANFLPNIPALSLIFIGWFFIWKFYERDSQKYLWISMLFFSLGMLIKVSSGISFIALLGWLLIELLAKKEKRILLKKPVSQLLPFGVAIAVVVAWYIYAEYYNNVHGGKYTFNSVWPVWELTNVQIQEIITSGSVLLKPAFLNDFILYLTGGMWIFLLISWKSRILLLNYLLVIIPFGSLLYSLLWFQAFNVHDYYLIDFYVNIIMIWLLFFKTVGESRWVSNWIVNTLLIVLLVYGISDCGKKLKARYEGWPNEAYMSHLKAVGELEPVFLKLGIGPDDKVISIPDESINVSLYLMNRSGFCDFNSNFKNPGTFQNRIDKGAKYLIVNDTLVLDDKLIRPFTKYPLTTYKNVKIFDLRPFRN